MDLKNKVAIVTGGAQGIGKHYCLSLLEHGCKVCVCDVNEKSGKEFVETVSGNYKDKLIFIKCDVSQLENFKDAFRKAADIFGQIDILINNAGIVSEQDWMKMIGVNFIGVINGIQIAFQHMGVNNGGSGGLVINTASNTGLSPFELSPIYSGCKHGVVGLTKSYGTDFHLKKTGITVNAICPGPINTELYHSFPEKSVCAEAAKELLSTLSPLDPSVVASGLIKLIQDQKNGSLLMVDNDGTRYVS